MKDGCRIPHFLVAGLLSAAFHAGVAPVAAGVIQSPPPPPFSLFVGAAADGDVELAVRQRLPDHMTADDQPGTTSVQLLVPVSPLVSQVRSTASCSYYGMVREAVLCVIGWGIPALKGWRMGRKTLRAIRDGVNVLDAVSMVLGSFFCMEIYESYEAWEQCRRGGEC